MNSIIENTEDEFFYDDIMNDSIEKYFINKISF